MGNKQLLVLIDDDTDEHEIFKMAVDDVDQALECIFFVDCESAIAHFSQNSVTGPGYVFMDFKLPRIDGDKCLQDLQKLRQFDQPLIIVFSSSLSSDWQEKLLNAGVDEFMEKTASIELLTQKIEGLLRAG